MVTADTMRRFWDHYVPDHDARTDPDVSPLRAASLAGLPPAIVLTAEHDPLRSEGERYARLLAAAGVPVVARRFDGQMHGFLSMVTLLPASAQAIDYIATELSALLRPLDAGPGLLSPARVAPIDVSDDELRPPRRRGPAPAVTDARLPDRGHLDPARGAAAQRLDVPARAAAVAGGGRRGPRARKSVV